PGRSGLRAGGLGAWLAGSTLSSSPPRPAAAFQPKLRAKLTNLGLELFDTLACFLDGDPRIGIQRLSLRTQLLHARRFPRTLDDARLKLGIAGAEANEL